MVIAILGIVMAAAGVVAGFATWRLALEPRRSAAREASVDRFLITRQCLKSNRADLIPLTLSEEEIFRVHPDLPVLTKEHWIPPTPLTLESVSLNLEANASNEDLYPSKELVRRLMSFGRDGFGAKSYSEAIELYDRPSLWFDSASYRLLDIRTSHDEHGQESGLEFIFGMARYFDAQDTAEFLAYEVADRAMQKKRPLTGGAYRKWLEDPFRFDRRCAVPGISALTIRRATNGCFFFMHRRDSNNVAVGMSTTHVVPSGEFQPHNDILPVWRLDLSLWNTVMREYAEEYLGQKGSAGNAGLIIDYARDEPYRRLAAARSRGDVTVRFLGIGLDPVRWKPEIALACVWDASAFDRIFRRMLSENAEGTIITGRRVSGKFEGIPFNEVNVLGYAKEPTTLPAGRMCLSLAWRWRGELGIN